MDLCSFSTIYIIFCILIGLKEYHSYEAPCKEYEVIMCGDEDSEWAICTPKTSGVRRILTAQLDTRYRNRYCRKYGTPEHFGLSSSGRSMWTVGWCYGTFFLCLEIDHSFESRDYHNNELEQSPEHFEGTTTSPGYGPTSTDSESIETSDISTESDYTEDEFIVETGPLETEEYITNDEYFESEMLRADNGTLDEKNQELIYYGLDPRMKFWLIFGIVGGGVIVIVLICAVAYLTIQCCDDSNTDDVHSSKPGTKASRKYFRPQKWSTSALVTSEPEHFSDVYDFIPATKLASSASIKTEHETNGKVVHKEINDQTNKKNIGQDKTYKEGSSIQDAINSTKRNSLKRNDYFILMPQALEAGNENEKCVVYTPLSENIYDHLVRTPTTSVSDSSTYHCLNFKRDESLKERDMVATNKKDETNSEPDASLEQENNESKSECSSNDSNDKNVFSQKEIVIKLEKDLNFSTDDLSKAVKTKPDTKDNCYKTAFSERTNVLHTEI